MAPTPWTTRKCQDLGAAPIVWSLPRSPCLRDAVVWVRFVQVYNDASSIRADYNETRGRPTPHTRYGSLLGDLMKGSAPGGRRVITTSRQGSQRQSAPSRRLSTTLRPMGGLIDSRDAKWHQQLHGSDWSSSSPRTKIGREVGVDLTGEERRPRARKRRRA